MRAAPTGGYAARLAVANFGEGGNSTKSEKPLSQNLLTSPSYLLLEPDNMAQCAKACRPAMHTSLPVVGLAAVEGRPTQREGLSS
jgi:hypothetical protein